MKNVIIAEPNYLIRKGFAQLLNQLENIRIEEACTFSELKLTLKRKGSSFVFINNKLIENSSSYILLQNEYSFTTLLIKDCSDIVDIKIPFKTILNIDDSEEVLINKIENEFNKKGENNQKGSKTLSQREILILKHVALGLTNKEIADTLFISTHTVITHRKNITAKLGIRSISGLTVYAILNNIININEVKN